MKTRIKKIFKNLMLNNLDILIDDKYKISLSDKTDTAYYFYEPPHNIVLGKSILEKNKKRKANEDYYIESYIVHELSHSLWSPNIKLINKILTNKKIPFLYFNYFEDARIEHLYRKKYNRYFNWSLYEIFSLKPEKITPLNIFFYFIFTENEKYTNEVEKYTYENIISNKYFSDIKNFYLKALEIKNINDMIELIEEFYEKYKNSIDEEQSNSISNFSNEFDLAIKDNYKTKNIKNSLIYIDIGDNDGKKNKDKRKIDNEEDVVPSMEDIDTKILDEIKNYIIFSSKKTYLSEKEIKEIEENGQKLINYSLKYIFKKRIKKEFEPNVSKKMDTKRLVLDRDDIYIHTTKTKKSNLKSHENKFLSIVVDVSGSMSIISLEVLTILYVFNELAKMKLIDLKIYLTGGRKRKPLNLELTAPVSKKTLYNILFMSDIEGMENCFTQHLKTLRKSNIIFVITDGMLVDKPIDKKNLNKKGIFTRAIYVENDYMKYNEKIKKGLYKYFDTITIKKTVEEIFEEIISKYKNI